MKAALGSPEPVLTCVDTSVLFFIDCALSVPFHFVTKLSQMRVTKEIDVVPIMFGNPIYLENL